MTVKFRMLHCNERTSNASFIKHLISFQILRLRYERAHLTRTERVVAVATDIRVFAALHEGRLLAGRFRQSLQASVV